MTSQNKTDRTTTWKSLFDLQQGGEVAIPDPPSSPPVQQSRADPLQVRRSPDDPLDAARNQTGTDAAELLARCQALRAANHCPGVCVYTGQLHRLRQ